MATEAVGGRAAEVVSEEAKEARAAGRGLEAGEVGCLEGFWQAFR